MSCPRNIIGTAWLFAILLVGCGQQIPRNIISPERMEDILYDYHLSIAMSAGLNHSDNYQREAYKRYVFEKHGTTEAEFDSSMVWYTRHTEKLAAIYKNLGVRFRDEKKLAAERLAAHENRPVVSEPGDTVDVWYGHRFHLLADAPLANRVVFEIPSDSNFFPKDAFLWSAQCLFLSDSGARKAVMGFNVLFDNDSVTGQVCTVTHSGLQSLYLKPDSVFGIKSVNGFIYYENADSVGRGMPGLVVDGITLMRYHEPKDTTSAVTDTLSALSVQAPDTLTKATDMPDTVRTEIPDASQPVRLSPRDMRKPGQGKRSR